VTGMRVSEGAAAVALAASVGLAVAAMAEAWPVTVDDAFISLRHARHWAERGSPSFDATEHIEAYSNFLWVALGAALLRLGGDPVWILKALGALCALGSVLGSVALAARCGARPAFARLAGALVGVSSGAAFWAVSGMETPLFALLLTGGVWALQARSPRVAAPLLLLASLTRLEGPVLVAAAIAAAGAVRWREGARPAQLLREHLFVLVPAAGYLAWFAWRWSYYGHLFPSPIYFKRALSAGDVGASYGAGFLVSSLPLLALAAAAPFAARRDSAPPVAVVAAALVVFAGARREVQDGVSTMAWLDRYFVPVLPCLAAAAAASLDAVARRLGTSGARGVAVAGLAVFLLVWQLGNPAANPAKLLVRTRGYPEAVAARGAPSAAYVQQQWGDRGTVAAGDIGRLGWVFRGRVLDLFGLAGYDYALRHGGALEPHLDAILARRPDAIVLCFDAERHDPPRPCQDSERVLMGRPGFAAYAEDAVFGREAVPRAYHVVYRRRAEVPE